ncbi:uncharacterized protein F5891DRAFT_1169195 [Suillus fuscotomentosus]|uniref:Uncharacterized protein n=1 Tax=Suillus fuscotomentosus TaxID=1912939 RepID=A0AAD4ENL2_9AGAM|nr:uncharacterized protein F5891DRAFT_1169195 [Suillus fuscotomentosus]KAG1908104.1 hypothetical protein F5891DRAFT_1169195 [Suillus fuscotomentosus]
MTLRELAYTTFRLNLENEVLGHQELGVREVADKSAASYSYQDQRHPTTRERFGFPNIGVRHPEFQQLLIDTAQKHSVEIKWGHQAIEFEQAKMRWKSRSRMVPRGNARVNQSPSQCHG